MYLWDRGAYSNCFSCICFEYKNTQNRKMVRTINPTFILIFAILFEYNMSSFGCSLIVTYHVFARAEPKCHGCDQTSFVSSVVKE